LKQTLVIAHGGGPTAVINASLAGVIEQAKKSSHIDRILAAKHGIQGVINEDFLDLTELDSSDLQKLKNTPSSAIGSCRYKVKQHEYAKIVESLEKQNTGIFLYNGGNDSMDTCLKVSKLVDDIKVIGIPKTIDNDLVGTDHCPGFGSSARYYAQSALELALDVQALNIHVCVAEIFGRNTGWLTASTALAHYLGGLGPKMILVPEVRFLKLKFLDRVQELWDKSNGFLITCSEGLIDEEGNPVVESSQKDSFGHSIAGNVSQYLSELIKSELNIRSRSEKPGILGRVSFEHISEVDRDEAFEVGKKAVVSALNGESGKMVVIKRAPSKEYQINYSLLDLKLIANKEKKLPEKFIDRENFGINKSFYNYCRPLVGDNWPEFFQIL